MTADGQLLERVRRLVAGDADVVEKQMVGGRSFSVGGRMFCGVTPDGLMVRVGADRVALAVAEPYVSTMRLGGKPLSAFVVVAHEGVRTDAELAPWMARGRAVALR